MRTKDWYLRICNYLYLFVTCRCAFKTHILIRRILHVKDSEFEDFARSPDQLPYPRPWYGQRNVPQQHPSPPKLRSGVVRTAKIRDPKNSIGLNLLKWSISDSSGFSSHVLPSTLPFKNSIQPLPCARCWWLELHCEVGPAKHQKMTELDRPSICWNVFVNLHQIDLKIVELAQMTPLSSHHIGPHCHSIFDTSFSPIHHPASDSIQSSR